MTFSLHSQSTDTFTTTKTFVCDRQFFNITIRHSLGGIVVDGSFIKRVVLRDATESEAITYALNQVA